MLNLQKNTLKGPACWVCGVRFKTSIPPGPLNKEDHHIFPRNAGGTDGPEVSLCEHHHGVIHKVANRMHTSKPFDDLLAGEPNPQRLAWLAMMIVKAERLFASDPNKSFHNGVQFNRTELEMMKKLQSIYPDKSRSDIIRAAFFLFYKKHFP